jgi:hypothetical protein
MGIQIPQGVALFNNLYYYYGLMNGGKMKIANQLKCLKIAITPLIFILLLILSFSFNGCKGFGIPDYKMEIIFEEGVDGTPIPGNYSYEELATIEYSYFPINEDHTVEVLINENRWPAAGSIVVYANMKLVVRLFDIRGTWDFTLEDNDSSDEWEFSITFSGGNFTNGSFSDSQGHNGTWTIDGTVLTITYSNWSNYVLTGSISDMDGDWSGDDLTGTWSAVRQ